MLGHEGSVEDSGWNPRRPTAGASAMSGSLPGTKEVNNMANKPRTSKSVAKKASKQLRSKTSTAPQRSVAASALNNRKKK